MARMQTSRTKKKKNHPMVKKMFPGRRGPWNGKMDQSVVSQERLGFRKNFQTGWNNNGWVAPEEDVLLV